MNDREKFCLLYAGGKMLSSEVMEDGMPEEVAIHTFNSYMTDLCKRYGLEYLYHDENLIEEIDMFMGDVSSFCESETKGNLSK